MIENYILSGLEPSNVFKYFEEICAIPHGSRNTRRLSDYLVDFSIDHGLQFIQDDYNNVVIYKDGCRGGEDSDTVILQGHIDMVCEKEENCDIDFITEGLRLQVEGNVISANGTTLGGDDGIAVAYMLALLDSDEIPHPPLECVFTVDEEIGMLGAAAFNMQLLTGRKLLNIDSEEEGYLLVSCAGGATATIHIPYSRRGAQGKPHILTVSGLTGGHSGVEIDKGRANADIVLANILKELSFEDDTIKLVSLTGGLKDNAIPVKAEAKFVTLRPNEIDDLVQKISESYKEQYKDTDPYMSVSVEPINEYKSPIREEECLSIILTLNSLPNGVQKMSSDIEGLVQTSLNLGIMETNETEISLSFSVRSSIEKEKLELIEQLQMLAIAAGGYVTVEGSYPAWEYRADSPLRDTMTSVFEEMYGRSPVVEAIHAGLECGLFAGALEGLDVVSFGPDMLDIHTPKERMMVDSVERTWQYLLKVLERLI